MQKSALFTVPRADLLKVHPVVRRRSSPCPKYLINPYNAMIVKSQGSKDIKNDILGCQIHKYKCTNAQIHKYTRFILSPFDCKTDALLLHCHFHLHSKHQNHQNHQWDLSYGDISLQITNYKFHYKTEKSVSFHHRHKGRLQKKNGITWE